MDPLEALWGSPLVHRFGCGLLHFLWQGLLIAVILAVAMWILRGRSAGARYLTAWTALLVMVVSVPLTAWLVSPPPVTQPEVELPTDSAEIGGGAIRPYRIEEAQGPGVVHTPAAPAPGELPAVASTESADDLPAAASNPLAVRASELMRPALPWVVCCWVVGTFALSLWRLSGWIYLRRLCRLGTNPASDPAGQMLERLLKRLGVDRAVQLLESALIEVPMVIGWLRPVILLPASILAELPAEQLELILAHELAHIRRHDFLLNLLQTAIETLLFYHPAVWWVSRRIRIEREACCDDLAVAGCGDRLLYARALTKLEELRHEPAGIFPARVGVAADGAPLLSRIRRVLGLPGNDQQGRRTWLGGSVAVLLLIGALVGYAATAGEPPSKPAEVQSLKAKIREIESLCVPAKGTLRHAVEKRFGKGVSSANAKAPRKRGNPESTYWLYEFCENGALFICYGSESLSKVVSAHYLDPYSARGRAKPSTLEEQLRELMPRLRQMQLILTEYKKRFGEDYRNVWGSAVEGVQVRLRADKMTWRAGEDPSFQFDIRSQGEREKFIAYPQSFKVEVDRKWHTANFIASGGPRSVGFGGRLTYSLSLSDFFSNQTSDRPMNLGPGKHTIRAALSNVGEREETPGGEKGAIRFGRNESEAISNPVEIEIIAENGASSGDAEPEEAARPRFAGNGLVVDDETGKPVEHVAIQQGWPNSRYPSGIMWTTMITSDKGVRGGRFNVTHNCVKEGKVRIRIVADGYLPQVAIVDTEKGLLKETLVIRLKRGEEVRGRVIDHAGEPVTGAKVFLAGPELFAEIVDGTTEGFGGAREKTDADGRFVIHGAAKKKASRVVVLAPSVHVWMVQVPELGKELTIKLPQPATLVIRYDIDGDDPTARFRLQLKTYDMPDWRGLVGSVQWPTAENQAEVVLKNMTPGVYDVIRTKRLRVGNRGTEAFCDRCNVTLEPGKTTMLQFVRKRGHPIEGELVGLEGSNVPGAYVYVRSPEATGDPQARDEWKLPIYDGVACGKDGHFKTARIEPGQYTIVAHAYEPETSRTWSSTGWRLPAYTGTAKVTVTEDGPPPHVRIKMKPLSARRKATPAAKPAETTAESTVEAVPTRRVIDAQGSPIPGAKIGFYEHRTPRGKRPFASTVTNQAGKFPCPDQAPDKVRFSFYLVISAPGFRTGEWLGNYRVDGRRRGARLPDTLRLDRPVTISGKVLGPDGKPLAGVPLAVDYFNERGTWANPRRIQSDQQGRFKIDDLPPADIFIRYEKGKDETSKRTGDAQLFVSHVRAKDGEQVENVLVDLSKANCALEGQVVDHEGNGIADVSIKATFAASASRLVHYAWTKTDQQGRYRIEGLPPHEFLVSAWTKNHYGGPGERVKLEIGETKTIRLLGYIPGHPAPEPKSDDPRWGKPAGDLRAAVELRPGRKSYELGEIVEVRPILRNTGEKTVTLIHDFAQAVELQVTDEAGNAQPFSYKNFSGDRVATTYVLEPGHEVEMRGRFRLKLVGADSTEDLIQTPGSLLAFALKCRPGAKYKLSCDLGDGLRTGETDLVVTSFRSPAGRP